MLTDILRQNLEDALNGYASSTSYPHRFKLYSGVGERDDMEKNPFIETPIDQRLTLYGVFMNSPQTLSPIRGITIISFSSTVEIIVPITRKGPQGDFPDVTAARNLLDGFSTSNNGTVQTVEDGGKQYTVSIGYSLSSCGDYSNYADTGEAVPVFLNAFFVCTESGLHGNDVQLMIDGEEIYFFDFKLSRVRLPDQYTTTETDEARTSISQSALGIDLALPFIDYTPFGVSVKKDLLYGKSTNAPHLVQLNMGKFKSGSNFYTDTYIYMMTLGNELGAVQPLQNVGMNLSLVESSVAIVEAWIKDGGTVGTSATGSEIITKDGIGGKWIYSEADGTTQAGYSDSNGFFYFKTEEGFQGNILFGQPPLSVYSTGKLFVFVPNEGGGAT